MVVFTPFNVAVIVVVPELALVANPCGLITATFTLEELQTTCDETSRIVPSLKVPLATNSSEAPSAILGEFGKMAKEVRVAFVTCNVAEPACPANKAAIVELPGATPVTWPVVPGVLLTIATEGAEDVQDTADVRFCVLPSAKVPSAVKFVEISCGTVRFDGRTVIEVKAVDSTTTLAALLTPPMDAVIVASPADCPVA